MLRFSPVAERTNELADATICDVRELMGMTYC
jgi:hypothetical protein